MSAAAALLSPPHLLQIQTTTAVVAMVVFVFVVMVAMFAIAVRGWHRCLTCHRVDVSWLGRLA
jgi:hypothetical protein